MNKFKVVLFSLWLSSFQIIFFFLNISHPFWVFLIFYLSFFFFVDIYFFFFEQFFIFYEKVPIICIDNSEFVIAWFSFSLSSFPTRSYRFFLSLLSSLKYTIERERRLWALWERKTGKKSRCPKKEKELLPLPTFGFVFFSMFRSYIHTLFCYFLNSFFITLTKIPKVLWNSQVSNILKFFIKSEIMSNSWFQYVKVRDWSVLWSPYDHVKWILFCLTCLNADDAFASFLLIRRSWYIFYSFILFWICTVHLMILNLIFIHIF